MTNENLKVIELSSYTSPKVVEDKRKEWVAYGDDNDYLRFWRRKNGLPYRHWWKS